MDDFIEDDVEGEHRDGGRGRRGAKGQKGR
jgi:hypothetical protein